MIDERKDCEKKFPADHDICEDRFEKRSDELQEVVTTALEQARRGDPQMIEHLHRYNAKAGIYDSAALSKL